MKAIKIQPGSTAAVVDAPLPRLRPGCVIVKTVAVAINPVDWKHIKYVPRTDGCTAGSDFAGVVRKVGANVTGLKPGDRVAGWTHGGNISNREEGSFAEYIVAKASIMLKIPDHMSYEEAATLGVGLSTIGLAFYKSMALPLPAQLSVTELPRLRSQVLVYGGSTATGTLAIQFAKLSGLNVVTICSPHSFEMVKSYGADTMLDYKDPDAGKRVREHTNNNLCYAIDCISTDKSAQICADALSSDVDRNLTYSAVLYCNFPRSDVQVKVTVAHTIFGEDFIKPELGPENFPRNVEDHEFGKSFWQLSEKLLMERKIRVHPLETRQGGLEGVLEGLDDLMQGAVSGKKLVYNLVGRA